MKGTSGSLIPTLALAIIANAVIFYFIYAQISGVNRINQEWQKARSQSLEIAVHLAEVERSFGYVGFIHHFKNYIIRRTDAYYTEAIESHQQAAEALEAFKNQPALSERERQYIQTIEKTLADYADKLVHAKNTLAI